MTTDQIKHYLLHPRQWISWKLAQVKLWRMKRKAQKDARAFMASIRQMEANLKAASYPSCPKCHGQGQRGFNLTTKSWVTCSCTYNPRTQDRVDAHPWLREAK
jgi:hypothetical protein